MEIYLATRMTSVVYTFMYISPPRSCIIIWYRIRVRNATRSRVAANDDGLQILSMFCEMQMEDQPKGRTNTCGERNAVWQLGFARDVLALFPTGHLARVSQAFWAGK